MPCLFCLNEYHYLILSINTFSITGRGGFTRCSHETTNTGTGVVSIRWSLDIGITTFLDTKQYYLLEDMNIINMHMSLLEFDDKIEMKPYFNTINIVLKIFTYA